MGEKETMAGADVAARSATLNVSASPGGSVSAGRLSAAVSSVGQLGAAGDPADAPGARLNSRPTADVTIPLTSDRIADGEGAPPALQATTVKSSKSNSSE